MAGLAGSSAVIPGGCSHFYYVASGVVLQYPAQTALMYQPMGIRLGWRANGTANISRPRVHPSPGTLVPNNLRQHRQNRGMMNGGGLHMVLLCYMHHICKIQKIQGTTSLM